MAFAAEYCSVPPEKEIVPLVPIALALPRFSAPPASVVPPA